MKIKGISASEIKDSRGNPAVEVELETDKGVFVDSCPAGASTGKNEANVLDVLKAIDNVNQIIAPKLKGNDVTDQAEIDRTMLELDGTKNKSKLGANAILAVSMAVCRAGAASAKATAGQGRHGIPLYSYIAQLSGQKPGIPLAMFNILNGGKHSKNGLAFQEFMVVPQKGTFVENLVMCNGVFQNLKALIEQNFGPAELGDEGGYAPGVKIEQALYLLKNAIGTNDARIALDCAASSFFAEGRYSLEAREMTRAELLEFYKELAQRFGIISIEDPFSEEDWQGFEEIMKEIGNRIGVIGDDLTTTNVERIKEAYNKQACNGVIIKPNQIGTITETIEAAKLAKSFNWKTIVSHRSGETMDDFIADLAVGLRADYLKAGSPAKPERMVKYGRLMEIEKEIK